MKIITIKSKFVVRSYEYGCLVVGFKHYALGMELHRWGIRLMFIWWHLCIRF